MLLLSPFQLILALRGRGRFGQFCRFLADHSDKFRTAGFQDLDPRSIPLDRQVAPLQSNAVRTAIRYGQQITRRILW